MQLAWGGGVRGIELSDRLYDSHRARRYSDNLIELVRHEAGSKGALAALDNRLATIAITENAEAFNVQRQVIADQIAEKFDLVEVWDAMNDQRTCQVCWGMDGERAVVGVGFLGGLRPGRAHARCRCTSHYERLTLH